MKADDYIPPEANRSPRERLRRLAKLSPLHRVLPRSMSVVAITVAVVLGFIVLLALAVGTPASELLKSYSQRLLELVF